MAAFVFSGDTACRPQVPKIFSSQLAWPRAIAKSCGVFMGRRQSMFEQSLVISSRQPIRSQRQWSTAAAASLEALVLSALAVDPLLHPAALPQITGPRAPAPVFSATQPEPAHARASSPSNAPVLMTESVIAHT